MKTLPLSVPAVVLAATLFVPAGASAQTEREVIDVAARGPQVGESIPDFSLVDQHGETWTRESILGENGAMLVFIRSADW